MQVILVGCLALVGAIEEDEHSFSCTNFRGEEVPCVGEEFITFQNHVSNFRRDRMHKFPRRGCALCHTHR